MRLLITGSKGQLGTELVRQAGTHQVKAADCDQLDITDAAAVLAHVKAFQPDAVINAAAYTAVDKAESDQDTAFAVNRDGPMNLARACEQAGIPLVHVSTDYVFDGCKDGAYVEEDVAAPLGVYGASKLAGEQAVQSACSKYLILRTSWVVSAHGSNFVKTMLRLGAEREELAVVADQYGCPTFADELARAIMAVLENGQQAWGIYHFCQPEPVTWHGFAVEIFAEAKRWNWPLKVKSVQAITSSQYPTLATRPANSVMDCRRFETTFGFTIHPWRASLATMFADNILQIRSDIL